MEDLEVLCRECHEAHHRAERAMKKKKPSKRRGISRRALYGYLTYKQRKKLINDFALGSFNELSCKLVHSKEYEIVEAAVKMLGFDFFFGKPKQKRSEKYSRNDRLNDPPLPSCKFSTR